MKHHRFVWIPAFVFLFAITAFGQNQNGCANGVRNGNVFTDCWADTGDDTFRLNQAVTAALGKKLFLNEDDYEVADSIHLFSYRIIEGKSRNSSAYPSSKITSTQGKPIFHIGEGVIEVSIRDVALVGGSEEPSGIGIYAAGGSQLNYSSLHFDFSNLRFTNLDYGIKVEALNSGRPEWQFDHVKLDQSSFELCNIGIYVKSLNSGWTVSSINFLVPAGGYGVYIDAISYSSFTNLIGNGTVSAPYSDKVFYVKEHGVLTIQNMVSEGFNEDLMVDGVNDAASRNFPINLINNHFNSKVTLKNATVVSIGNQFGFDSHLVPALAQGFSKVYSIGDKFCFEFVNCSTRSYEPDSTAEIVFSTNQFKNTSSVPFDKVKVGKTGYTYDINRSEADATLTFKGSSPGYGFTFDNNYGAFKVKNGYLNFDAGTIVLGSTDYAGLSFPHPNGTLYYCTNCQQTSTCSSGGSGAIAKKIAGAWKCN